LRNSGLILLFETFSGVENYNGISDLPRTSQVGFFHNDKTSCCQIKILLWSNM